MGLFFSFFFFFFFLHPPNSRIKFILFVPQPTKIVVAALSSCSFFFFLFSFFFFFFFSCTLCSALLWLVCMYAWFWKCCGLPDLTFTVAKCCGAIIAYVCMQVSRQCKKELADTVCFFCFFFVCVCFFCLYHKKKSQLLYIFKKKNLNPVHTLFTAKFQTLLWGFTCIYPLSSHSLFPSPLISFSYFEREKNTVVLITVWSFLAGRCSCNFIHHPIFALSSV